MLHVQLTVEPSGTQEDGVHVMLGLVGGSAHYSNSLYIIVTSLYIIVTSLGLSLIRRNQSAHTEECPHIVVIR